jgi:hypothetical protein
MRKNARLESAALAHPEVLWVNPVCSGVAVRGRGQTMLLTAAHCHIATLLATGEGNAMGIVTSRLCARPDLDLALYRVRWNAEPRTAVVSETGVSIVDHVRWIKWGGGRKSCAGGHVVAAHCDSAWDRRRFGCDEISDLWAGVVDDGKVCRLDSGGGVYRRSARAGHTEELVGIISRMMGGAEGRRYQHDDFCSAGQLVATVTAEKLEALFACAR